jgi:hypothetical protein
MQIFWIGSIACLVTSCLFFGWWGFLAITWLLIGMANTKYNHCVGGWLSMMGYNFPKFTIFILIPLTWILWPLLIWRWE